MVENRSDLEIIKAIEDDYQTLLNFGIIDTIPEDITEFLDRSLKNILYNPPSELFSELEQLYRGEMDSPDIKSKETLLIKIRHSGSEISKPWERELMSGWTRCLADKIYESTEEYPQVRLDAWKNE